MGIAVTNGGTLGSGDSIGSKLASGRNEVAAAEEVVKASTATEHRRKNRKEPMASVWSLVLVGVAVSVVEYRYLLGCFYMVSKLGCTRGKGILTPRRWLLSLKETWLGNQQNE